MTEERQKYIPRLEDILRLQHELEKDRVYLSDCGEEMVMGSRTASIVGSVALAAATGGIGAAVVVAGLAITSHIMTKNLEKKLSKEFARDESENYAQTQGFGATGQQLVDLLQVLPVVFGNRVINPNGGARVGGYLVHNRIFTKCGRQIKKSLFVVSIGEIGSISEKDTLIGEQPKENYLDEEVSIEYRLGTENQTVLNGFPFYSQCVRPPGLNSINLDLIGTISQAEKVPINIEGNENLEVTNGSITVISPGYDKAGLFGTMPIDPQVGGVMMFSISSPINAGVGLSNNDQDFSQLTIEFGFEFFGGQFQVIESGTPQTNLINYSTDAVFSLVITSDGTISYRYNGSEVFSSVLNTVDLLYFDGGFDSLGTVNNVTINGTPITTETSNYWEIKLDEEESKVFDKVNTDYYLARCQTEGEGTVVSNNFAFFTIIKKDILNRSIQIKELPALGGVSELQIEEGVEIFAWQFIRYETTKRVTTLELNFVWSLFATDREENEPTDHGIIYDIFIRRVDEDNLSHLIRCFTQGNDRNTIFTMITVNNLELGRYYLEVRPVYCENEVDRFPIYEINSYCNGDVVIPTAFENVFVSGEFNLEIKDTRDEDFINSYRFSRDKVSPSTESGAVGQLAFVNEIVLPEAINRDFTEVNYPNLAVVGLTYTVALNNDNISLLINECQIVPNYVNAGSAASNSTPNILVDLNNIFGINDETAQPGYFIKNIRTGEVATIIEFSSVSITHDEPIQWKECDEYVVYFELASPYFPDIFAWALTNKKWGLGKFFGEFADRFIDYRSIVETRQYCKVNNYFFDMWISQPISASEFLDEEAGNSRLFITKYGGKHKLNIHQPQPIKFTFNSHNVNEIETNVITQGDTKFNRVVIRYRNGNDEFAEDGRGRGRNNVVMIEDPLVFSGEVAPVEQRVVLNSVTNLQQAIDAGVVYYNLNKYQKQRVTFTTSYLGLSLESGDWFAIKFRHLERTDDFSGIVVSSNDDSFELDYLETDFSQVDIDGSFSASITICDVDTGTVSTFDNVSVTPTITDGSIVWASQDLPVSPLPLGSIVVLGIDSEIDRYYRCVSVIPSAEGTIKIEAVNVDASMFERNDLVVIDRDRRVI